MRFYRNRDYNSLIATDDSVCVIISKGKWVNNITLYQVPYHKEPNQIIEESTYEEFFQAYDSITAFITTIAEFKDKNGKGLRALLTDAKNKT